jgi:prepilin peptidase CpaA
MGTPVYAAWLLLVAALPISAYVAWSDMKAMKIPNVAVYALVGAFVILGALTLPFDDYLWRYSHLAVILLIGIMLNAAGLMGAGDAKFAAAAAPFIAFSDGKAMIVIYIGCFLGCYALHRIAKFSPIHKLAPDWQSWDAGKRFPMGFALGTTLVVYLLICAFPGAFPSLLPPN